MSSRTARRRFALRALAAALAVGYVFLAAVGDGLHRFACLSGCCDAVCCQSVECQSVAGDCLFCHHEGGCNEALGAESTGIAPCGSCPTESPQPHDSDCDVCRLLAQLKTATATVEVPAQVIWAAAMAPPESDPKAPSLVLPATSARGPPIA
ncbi:hypothetical protein [Botrimarina mediterranea]|nr:hypothetical protein [Botrimarina mediterranea]